MSHNPIAWHKKISSKLAAVTLLLFSTALFLIYSWATGSALAGSGLQVLLIAVAVICLASSLCLLFISRDISRSLQTLMTGAQKINAGDLEFRLETGAMDEFGVIANQLNQTIDHLTETQHKTELSGIVKSAFLANMSHEIRTPLSGIIGMTQLMLKSQLAPQQHAWLASIHTAAEHLLKILNEILDQSKLEAGKIELDPIDFDLPALVRDTVLLFQPQIAAKGLSLDIEFAPDVPEGVHADNFRIAQILRNLLSNAVKFTPSGSIQIRIECPEQSTTRLLLRCSVRDSGIGLNEASKDNIFAAFGQADSSISRTFGGTGLGLSISKQLAQLMGGELGVVSEEGVGSTFWFTVTCTPATTLDNEPCQNAPDEHWQASRPLAILVAEDTPILQQLIEQTLGGLGHRVTLANNGKEALELLNRSDFDLILLDIRMPLMDGVQAAQMIRARTDAKAQIPIIALTADLVAGNIKQYFAAGIDSVCAKPIDLAMLLTRINTLLGEPIHQLARPLSLAAAPSAEAPEQVLAAASHQHRWPSDARILLAEDMQFNQLMVTGVLKELGLAADIANHGTQALALLAAAPADRPYTLVLMDCLMPELDGYQASRAIRAGQAGEQLRQIPIIALSANTRKDDIQQCLDAGMNACLRKPIEADQLLLVLQRWLLPAATSDAATKSARVSAAPSQPDDPSVWDEKAALKRIMHKEDLLRSLIELYLQDTPAQIDTLQEALAKHDIEQAIFLLHALKGVAANLGALQLQHLAQELEALAQQQNITTLTERMPDLVQAHEALARRFQSYFDPH